MPKPSTPRHAGGFIHFEDLDEPAPQRQPARKSLPEQPAGGMVFISFGSGSSGNCAYIGTQEQGVLIDAGIDPDIVLNHLGRNGIAPRAVKAVVLTHDHQDHVRYVYRLIRTLDRRIAVYCTMRVMKGLLRRHNISSRVKDYKVDIWHETPFHVAGMEFTAFETSHDGSDNMGFSITLADKTFVVATDMGVITDRAAFYMAQADYLMIESNYDSEMLAGGRYPEYLKNRVSGPRGHLDNVVAADFVAHRCGGNLQWVFLCHLSQDNNTPEIALKAMRTAIERTGRTVGSGNNDVDDRDRDIQVYALPRYDATPLFVL